MSRSRLVAVDPGENRKATKAASADRAANSFEVVAREWHEKQGDTWAPIHSKRVIQLFERDLFPQIAQEPIEVLGFRADIIEHQLAHAVRDPNGAYNRTAHLPDRKRLMQEWADYLDKLKAGVKVLPFKQATSE